MIYLSKIPTFVCVMWVAFYVFNIWAIIIIFTRDNIFKYIYMTSWATSRIFIKGLFEAMLPSLEISAMKRSIQPPLCSLWCDCFQKIMLHWATLYHVNRISPWKEWSSGNKEIWNRWYICCNEFDKAPHKQNFTNLYHIAVSLQQSYYLSIFTKSTSL